LVYMENEAVANKGEEGEGKVEGGGEFANKQ
jgi:hypothetical protein